jgi:hypothetical protein
MKKTFERHNAEAVEAPLKVKPPSKFPVKQFNKDVILNRCKEPRGLAI